MSGIALMQEKRSTLVMRRIRAERRERLAKIGIHPGRPGARAGETLQQRAERKLQEFKIEREIEREIIAERRAAEALERRNGETDHCDAPSEWAGHMGAGLQKHHRYAIPRAA